MKIKRYARGRPCELGQREGFKVPVFLSCASSVIDEKVYRIGFISALIFARRRLCLHQRAVFVRWGVFRLSIFKCVCTHPPLCVRERGREKGGVRGTEHVPGLLGRGGPLSHVRDSFVEGGSRGK